MKIGFHYQKDTWYKSVSEISYVFTSKKSFSFKEKKVILTHFIQSKTLSEVIRLPMTVLVLTNVWFSPAVEHYERVYAITTK